MERRRKRKIEGGYLYCLYYYYIISLLHHRYTMSVHRFEDLEIWKESMRLCTNIYRLTDSCKYPALRDQIRRSSLSIPSNIAEGYDRFSNKEFIRFLYIAKASCAELRTQLYLCKALRLFYNEQIAQLIKKTQSISKMISRYIQVRQQNF